ncbi:cytochrome P450 [Epithele typhae]|uniref:cytochrome P450 n=1 Tax=Epithele typhae TaxID=378194 RepID=UPI002007ACB7|nr:cytochrome P450 [Epithele typhae]KAH9941567.1 cytochrome P450 [Epithele typhae]
MLPYAVAAAGVVWVLYKVLRLFAAKSPLDIVPGPPRKSLLAGNLEQLFDRDAWGFHDEVALQYGDVVKINADKWLYVFDPTALRQIVFKDSAFDQIPWLIESTRMLLGAGVLGVLGEAHKRQRKMLTPAFAENNLRELTPVVYEVARRLGDAVAGTVAGAQRDVDMLDWMGRGALEIIGQAGLGHSFDPLTSDTKSDAYTQAAKQPLSFTPIMVAVRQLSPILTRLGPAWFRRLLVKCVPVGQVQQLRNVVDTLYQTSVDIIAQKRALLESGKISVGKDIMSVLLKANMAASEADRLPDEQILGQMNILLFAATDTTSHVMAQILQLLSENPDIQEQVRREILTACDGDPEHEISYDRLHALPLLDAVCKETLRLYPPTPIVLRTAFEDSTLTLARPLRTADGTFTDRLFVPKDTNVLVGVRACNRARSLWGPDAETWRPARWLAEDGLPPALASAAVPGVYAHTMTFVGGPRSCVGFRFAQIEMKVVISTLLSRFAFEPSATPIFWNVSAITFPSAGRESEKPEMWLKVRPLAPRKSG